MLMNRYAVDWLRPVSFFRMDSKSGFKFPFWELDRSPPCLTPCSFWSAMISKPAITWAKSLPCSNILAVFSQCRAPSQVPAMTTGDFADCVRATGAVLISGVLVMVVAAGSALIFAQRAFWRARISASSALESFVFIRRSPGCHRRRGDRRCHQAAWDRSPTGSPHGGTARGP